MIPPVEVIVRLLLSAALCGLVGLERELRDQPAGFRTHILLGLGATLFTLISAYGFTSFAQVALQSGGRGIQFDPTRITAQIVTGVGFLGAGAIIRQGTDIRGLTTAASLWAAAAVGTAVGAGYYLGAVAATVVALLTLYGLRAFRSRMVSRFRTEFGVLGVTFQDAGRSISEVTEILDHYGIEVRSLDAEIESGQANYRIQVRIPPSANAQDTLGEIATLPGVKQVNVSGLHDME